VNKNETLEQFKWVDTHCHLQLTKDKIENLYLDNIEYLIIPGVDIESSLEARDVSLSLDKESYWSAGLHPHEADKFENLKETFDDLFIEADLIGETGLDYYRNLSTKRNQINSLKYHLDVANQLSKPVILHCRDSFSDMFDVLSEGDYKNPIILHSWTGGNRWTKKFIDLDVYFSISGIVTYDTAHDLHSAVCKIPTNRLLLETDIPYLAPKPHKGEVNKPSYIMYTAQKVSELLDVTLEELSSLTISNSNRLLSRTTNE
tara:strand:- start:1605 stop:2384 length:780 start_codon:yes stop_codon:yes gene_type:complete